ncbi:DNA/RNA non-specific endonuclease [Candidatus Nitrosacidococcus sp. I8]|uniref:DNA/RNA non-specific endonuclease n=1 Tax=Candidatus Nitrosacidococcus sp. I8 TaxID=2942908 RepID=UPI00222701FB|nr:DNA/RNA non-specific endonuclease [Candidatus Nitrosacidococcus sp. I8]CAH9018482.1 hypothetical protein NURINAE_00950 [Candidatus Nitrosacidococcus sp. I8]
MKGKRKNLDFIFKLLRRNYKRSPPALSLLIKVLPDLFTLEKRYPRLFFPLILLILGGLYGYELYARSQMVYMGIPKAINQISPYTWTRIFRNHGYIVGYSDLRGNPLWVSYLLKPVPENTPSYKRPPRFSSDWRNFYLTGHDSYTGSGYDRGHMAPNYAISHIYGQIGQLDTFKITNITPQTKNLNEKLWERLEEVGINHFTKQFGEVWVFTGPIFGDNPQRLKSSFLIQIPESFYKIYLVPPKEKGEIPKVLAFIMPQKVRGNEPLDHYLVSIDHVEEKTGFDFFHKLDDQIEQKLEAEVDSNPWHLKSVSKLPSRY